MGAWLAPVLGGLGAGVLVVVLTFAFRRTAPKWATGGRLAVVLVAAILIGAVTPVLLRPSEGAPAASEDLLAGPMARLRSAELDVRLTAIRELAQLVATNDVERERAIIDRLSEFVRNRAPGAEDPRCADSAPEDDVEAVLDLLRARPTFDGRSVVDLHGTCLANADLRAVPLPRAKLRSVNLSGSNLKSADLAGADLSGANLSGTTLVGTSLLDTTFIGARFSDTDVLGAQFSDDTLWPPQLEDAVMAASSFATTTFVIGELVLSDPR